MTAPVDLLRDVHIVDTPGHERDHPGARAAHDASSCRGRTSCSSSRRPTGRSPKPSARSSRRFATGARRSSSSSTRWTSSNARAKCDEVVAFVRDGAQRLLGVSARRVSGERAPGAAREAGRAGARGPPAGSRRSSGSCTRRSTRQPLPAEARQPARRRRRRSPAATRRSPPSGWRCCATISRCSTTSIGSSRVYREDLARGFEPADGRGREGARSRWSGAAIDYFEDTLRIGRVMDLLNRSRVQKEFEDRVVADAPQQIERRVTELIDWLIDQDFRAVAGGDGEADRAAAGARRAHARRAGRRDLPHRSRAADGLGRPRSAARRRHLRQAARGGEPSPTRRATAVADGGGGGRRGTGARHARHGRRVDGGGRRHRHPHGRASSRRSDF